MLETCRTIHLLGLEHIRLSIERKLDASNFPLLSKRRVVSDVFGAAAVVEEQFLYRSSTADELDKLKRMKKEWEELDRVVHSQ